MFDFKIIVCPGGMEIITGILKHHIQHSHRFRWWNIQRWMYSLQSWIKWNGKQGKRQSVDGNLYRIHFIKWLAYAD